MEYKFKKTIVIGLGGSIFFPGELNIVFLKNFRQFLKPFFKKHKFVIVVGGGRLARIFQTAALTAGSVSDVEKDWLGIYATRLNARLWQTVFGKDADPEMIVGRPKKKDLKYPVTLSSGWTPGWSTDYVAAALAKDFGAEAMISAGKPAYVYNRDNAVYPDAKPFEELTWKGYRRLIPKKWRPGDHSPVDPVAAELCDKAKVDAIVVRGDDFVNLGNLLKGQAFKGTIIR
ncbi:MAG: hypothetical protein Q8L36_03350 [bacterium]|nr:hypothetical protein [bacterium]